MMEFVNGKDDIPEILWKIPKMFETTNQIWMFLRPCGSTDNKIQFTNGGFLGMGAPIIIGLVNLFNPGWGKKTLNCNNRQLHGIQTANLPWRNNNPVVSLTLWYFNIAMEAMVHWSSTIYLLTMVMFDGYEITKGYAMFQSENNLPTPGFSIPYPFCRLFLVAVW